MLGIRTIMWDSARYPGGDHLSGLQASCPSVPYSVSSRVSVLFQPWCERQPQGFAFPSFQRCLNQRQKQERTNQSIRPDLLQLRDGDAPRSDNLTLGLMVGVNAALIRVPVHSASAQTQVCEEGQQVRAPQVCRPRELAIRLHWGRCGWWLLVPVVSNGFPSPCSNKKHCWLLLPVPSKQGLPPAPAYSPSVHSHLCSVQQ